MSENTVQKKYTFWSNLCFIFKHFFGMYPSARGLMLVSILSEVAVMLLSISIPTVAMGVIEKHLGMKSFVIRTGGVIIVYALLTVINEYTTQHYRFMATVARAFGGNLCLIEKSLTTDYQNIESHENRRLIGKAQYSISGNTIGMEQIYDEFPLFIARTVILSLFGSVIFLIDFRILIIMVFMLVFNIIFNNYARNYMKKRDEENTEIWRKQNYLYEQSSQIKSGKDVRIFHMERWLGSLYQWYIDSAEKWQKSVEKRWYLPVMSDTVFIALRDGFAYFFLIHMAFRGEISLAGFTLMIGTVSSFSDQVFAIVTSLTNLLTANGQVIHFRKMLDMEDVMHHTGGIRIGNGFQTPPEIEFRHVSFRYHTGGEKEEEIFHDINLKIRPGEKLALVGNNGAGKTTFVKLLCGFYLPTEGEVLVNGINIQEYNIEDYYHIIGAVFQEADCTAFTLANIVSGREKTDTDMERFWMAVERAGLKEKIESLDKKEDTHLDVILDEKGIQLSGGEMQKLMLARCIYKDAPVMILDEPTAALDPIAESRMYEAYNEMAEGKTSIFISHRLASTRFCDRIIFLADGRIAETGTHKELLQKGGEYARIYDIQSHYYKDSVKKEELADE